jgi:hypothetical protein
MAQSLKYQMRKVNKKKKIKEDKFGHGGKSFYQMQDKQTRIRLSHTEGTYDLIIII